MQEQAELRLLELSREAAQRDPRDQMELLARYADEPHVNTALWANQFDYDGSQDAGWVDARQAEAPSREFHRALNRVVST